MDTLNQPSSNQPTNQPTPEQPLVPPPKSSLHPKALLITFALFLIFFASLTAILLGSRTKSTSQLRPSVISPTLSQPSPTPDETVYTEATRSANWKTYKDRRGEFEFKYPETWNISGAEGAIVFLETDGLGFSISYAFNNPESEAKRITESASKEFFDVSAPKRIIVNGNELWYVEQRIKKGYGAMKIYFVESKDMKTEKFANFQLLFNFQKESAMEKYGSVIDQILSTFRFIE